MTTPLRWSNAPPTQPGWYWWRGSRSIQVIFVSQAHLDLLEHCPVLYGSTAATGCQWAGPIPEPEESPATAIHCQRCGVPLTPDANSEAWRFCVCESCHSQFDSQPWRDTIASAPAPGTLD